MLRLARRAGKLEIEEDAIQAIKEVRDGAAHVSENLVSDYEDVKKLAEVKRQSLRILHS
jgi:predicted transcriptional regulator